MTRQRAKIKCGLPDAAKPWKVCSFHGVNLKRYHQQVHKKKQNLAELVTCGLLDLDLLQERLMLIGVQEAR